MSQLRFPTHVPGPFSVEVFARDAKGSLSSDSFTIATRQGGMRNSAAW